MRHAEPLSWAGLVLRAAATALAVCTLLAPLMLLTAPSAHAQPDAGGGLSLYGPHGLLAARVPQRKKGVRVAVTGVEVRVHVTQRFSNPNERWLEGHYVFPLPEDAAVDRPRLHQARLGVDQIVLAGAGGQGMAFGAGHVSGSVAPGKPGKPGNLVTSGHRDSHFRWLGELRQGDELELEAADGRLRRYRVAQLAVHHASEGWLLDPMAGDQLRLPTCYPFDAVDPGTPLRYVATAYPASPAVF
jgi:sortase A